MRVFKSAGFDKFARREGISDEKLCEAVARAERGLIDADLRTGIIKQRIARSGEGRSGGYRTLIFFKVSTRAVFVTGYAKNDRANKSGNELIVLRKAAKLVLGFTDAQLDAEVSVGRMMMVKCDGKTV